MIPIPPETAKLARGITRAGSLQTFATIGLLADRRRTADAYRAYAYFRWLDDWLDTGVRDQAESLELVARQRALVERCFAGADPGTVSREEAILVDLIHNHPARGSGVENYVTNMLDVLAFDASRRGRLISLSELNAYQHSLAVAVTECMFYFIGPAEGVPPHPGRYLAVKAAHITHMLRDTMEDVRGGYFNIASEFLRAHGIGPMETESPAYGAWVQMRVALAREYFAAARDYLSLIRCARFRLAVSAYTARFQIVLDLIERDGFTLRPDYQARKTVAAGLRMAGAMLMSALGDGAAPRAGDSEAGDRSAEGA